MRDNKDIKSISEAYSFMQTEAFGIGGNRQASERQLQSLEKEFERIAGRGEIEDVDQTDTAIIAFGSELGVLRLYHQYTKTNSPEKFDVDYSRPSSSWYFTINM